MDDKINNIICEIFSTSGATLYKNPSDQTVYMCIIIYSKFVKIWIRKFQRLLIILYILSTEIIILLGVEKSWEKNFFLYPVCRNDLLLGYCFIDFISSEQAINYLHYSLDNELFYHMILLLWNEMKIVPSTIGWLELRVSVGFLYHRKQIKNWIFVGFLLQVIFFIGGAVLDFKYYEMCM